MSLSPHVRIRLLANRAIQENVLESNNVGVVVHALRSLGALSVSNGTLLQAIERVAETSNARSQCNILHAISYSMREQYDVHSAPSAVQMSLILSLQQGIERSVQTLTPPECVLASEALIALQPWGCSDAGLVALLQERTSTLTPFVQRPIELIGLLKVAIEAMYNPISGVSDADRDVAAANWETELSDLVLTISMNLPGFRKQDLITLMDAVILRGSRPLEINTHTKQSSLPLSPSSSSRYPKYDARRKMDNEPKFLSAEEEMEETIDNYSLGRGEDGDGDGVENADAARGVPPPCQALVKAIVDRVVEKASDMSASQLCAWLHRLSLIGWFEHPAFIVVVRNYNAALNTVSNSQSSSSSPSPAAMTDGVLHFRTPNSGMEVEEEEENRHENFTDGKHLKNGVSTSQLATAGHALSQLLSRDIPDSPGRSESGDVSGPERVIDSSLAYGSAQDTISLTDSERQLCCATLRSIVELQAVLSGKIYVTVYDPHKRAKAAMDTYRLLVALPQQCCSSSSAFYHTSTHSNQSHMLNRSNESSSPSPRSASHMMTQQQQIPPEILAKCVGNVLKFAENELTARQLTTLVSRVFMWRIQRYVPDIKLSQDESRKSKEKKDLTSYIRESTSTKIAEFNAHDLLQMLNEIATSAYEDDAIGSQQQQQFEAGKQRRDVQSSQASFSEVHSSNRAVRELFFLLHARAQSIPGKSAVHTAVIVRYLSSMSKMGVRKRAEYSKVLLLLKQRPLTDFELLRVLGVAARHHVAAVEFTEQAALRLTEFRERLFPIQRCLLLKYLGQGRSHKMFRVPRHRFLDNFLSRNEIQNLSAVSAAMALIGLVELRQYFNDAIPHLLKHLDSSVNISSIQSTASLTELVAALLRLGWEEPAAGNRIADREGFSDEGQANVAYIVPESLLVAALEAATARLSHSRSLFADSNTLSLYWDLLKSGGGGGGDQSSRDHASQVASASRQFETTIKALLETRIQDIAQSDSLSPNTFLLSQLAIAYRFGVQFERSSSRSETSAHKPSLARYVPRLADNIAYHDLAKLATNAREIPHVASTALAVADEKPYEAHKLLRFVVNNVGSLNANEVATLYRHLSTETSRHTNVSRVIHELRESLRNILGSANHSAARGAWIRLAPHECNVTLMCYNQSKG